MAQANTFAKRFAGRATGPTASGTSRSCSTTPPQRGDRLRRAARARVLVLRGGQLLGGDEEPDPGRRPGLPRRLHRRRRRVARRRPRLHAARPAGPARQAVLVGHRLRRRHPLPDRQRAAARRPRLPRPRPASPTTTARSTSTSARAARRASESNWVQTIPGRHWFSYFRLYGPLEPYFDRSWKLGDITPVCRTAASTAARTVGWKRSRRSIATPASASRASDRRLHARDVQRDAVALPGSRSASAVEARAVDVRHAFGVEDERVGLRGAAPQRLAHAALDVARRWRRTGGRRAGRRRRPASPARRRCTATSAQRPSSLDPAEHRVVRARAAADDVDDREPDGERRSPRARRQRHAGGRHRGDRDLDAVGRPTAPPRRRARRARSRPRR